MILKAPFRLPSSFLPAFGYQSGRRSVALFWEPCGDEACYHDGQNYRLNSLWFGDGACLNRRALEIAVANGSVRRALPKRQRAGAAAIFSLMLYTGCRVSDLVSLELTDLMLGERSGTVVFRFGKGGKQRPTRLIQLADVFLSLPKDRLLLPAVGTQYGLPESETSK